MTTAEGGSKAADSAPTNDASSSYGEGGVGGKFRKKPFRGRQSTPYDRPSTANRPNRSGDINRSGWLSKIVLDPASKLISYGADRIFSSVFRRKQLPPPLEDVNDDVNEDVADVVSNNQSREQEPDRGQHRPPVDVTNGDSISELEQLLKQKTFTRTQITHLTELLRSRAEELSNRGNDEKATTKMLSKLASGYFEEDRTNGVLDDNIASPAELAKSYMGSIPSKVSPSYLAMRGQTIREPLGNTPFRSMSSNMSLSKNMFRGIDAPENSFITPQSRGKSATYNMARSPYSRLYSASTSKGTGVMSIESSRPSLSSASAYFVERDDKLVKHKSLKRRNTFIDDGFGSVGPIRRIRQKTNLLATRTQHSAHAMVAHSDVKQKGILIGETMHNIRGTVKENENQSGPSTSYARVPSKSSEVAARIFQQLEKLSPNEKLSQSKFVAGRERSHFELKPSMLSGQALRSLENVESVKKHFDIGHELPNRSDSCLIGAVGSSPVKQVNEVKNVSIGSLTHLDPLNCVPDASGPSFEAKKDSAPQHLPKDNTCMSAEVSLEKDGSIAPDGLVQRPSSVRGSVTFRDSKLFPTEKPEPAKLMGRTEENPSFFKIGESGDPGTVTGVTTASESLILPPPASVSGELEETNYPPPLFSFSSVADKFSESNKQEFQKDGTNSLLSFPASSSWEIPSKLDKAGHFNSVTAGVANEKSENMPPVQFNVSQPARPASSSDTNQTPVDGGLSFTYSATVASFSPSVAITAVSSGTSIFGSASNAREPMVRFGATEDQITTISAAPSTNGSENLRRKMDNDSSSASVSAFATSAPTSYGSGTSPFFSSFSNSTAGKLTDAATSSLFTSGGTFSQGASGQLVSSDSLPSFNAKPNSDNNFGSTSTASHNEDTGKAIVAKGPRSLNVFKIDSSSSAATDSSTVTSSSNSSASAFSFGLNRSSSSSTTLGTSSVATPSAFVFGANSSVSSSPTNTTSGTSAKFSIGTTSSPSNIFGSNWEAKTSSPFGSTTASLSQSTVFSFAASSAQSSASTSSNSSQSIGLSTSASSTPPLASTNTSPFTGFTFGAPSASSSSSFSSATPSLYAGFVSGASSSMPIATPSLFTSSSSTGFSLGGTSSSSSTPLAPSTNISPAFFTSSAATYTPNSIFPFATTSGSASPFGSSPFTGFGASQGNSNSNDQMNNDDTMAEDTVQAAAAPSFPAVFGQASAPSLGNPFVFGGQQPNQPAPQNLSPFQGSGSAQFNVGGGFSLGSGGPGGGDKSGRKIVKINRNKHRKK